MRFLRVMRLFFCDFPTQLSHKKQPTAAHCGQSCALLHTLSRRSLVRRRMHPPTGNRQFRAQLLRAGKSAKITSSKIKFLSLECRGNTRFLKNYGIYVIFRYGSEPEELSAGLQPVQQHQLKSTSTIIMPAKKEKKDCRNLLKLQQSLFTPVQQINYLTS